MRFRTERPASKERFGSLSDPAPATADSSAVAEEPDSIASPAGTSEPGARQPGDVAAADSTAAHDPAAEEPAGTGAPRGSVPNMLPGRERRRLGVERLLTRLVATCGIVAIGVAIAAIMVSSNTQGWIVGLVVALVSVILSAILWSSRQL